MCFRRRPRPAMLLLRANSTTVQASSVGGSGPSCIRRLAEVDTERRLGGPGRGRLPRAAMLGVRASRRAGTGDRAVGRTRRARGLRRSRKQRGPIGRTGERLGAARRSVGRDPRRRTRRRGSRTDRGRTRVGRRGAGVRGLGGTTRFPRRSAVAARPGRLHGRRRGCDDRQPASESHRGPLVAQRHAAESRRCRRPSRRCAASAARHGPRGCRSRLWHSSDCGGYPARSSSFSEPRR